MARFFIFIVTISLLASACKSGKNKSAYKLDGVKKEMSMSDVRDVTGEPTNIEDLGTATDEDGDTTHIVTWYYGDNESVTFINSKVNDIDMDRAATQKRLNEIMDSAKQAQRK